MNIMIDFSRMSKKKLSQWLADNPNHEDFDDALDAMDDLELDERMHREMYTEDTPSLDAPWWANA
jgi:hypothetical protein